MFDRYLDHVQTRTIPVSEAATGPISISVFQRRVVGYVELLTLTMWQSEQALPRSLEDGRRQATRGATTASFTWNLMFMNFWRRVKLRDGLQRIHTKNDLVIWHICPAEPQVAQHNSDNPQNGDLYEPSRKIFPYRRALGGQLPS